MHNCLFWYKTQTPSWSTEDLKLRLIIIPVMMRFPLCHLIDIEGSFPSSSTFLSLIIVNILQPTAIKVILWQVYVISTDKSKQLLGWSNWFQMINQQNWLILDIIASCLSVSHHFLLSPPLAPPPEVVYISSKGRRTLSLFLSIFYIFTHRLHRT